MFLYNKLLFVRLNACVFICKSACLTGRLYTGTAHTIIYMLCMFLHIVLYAKLRSAKSFEVYYIRKDKDRLMRVDGTR
jgi:hypothetical protein